MTGPDYSTPEFYRAIARAADHAERLGHGDALPLDLPDWDWPDAPHPEPSAEHIAAMERESLRDQASGPGAIIWITICAWITIGSLYYLYTQVRW